MLDHSFFGVMRKVLSNGTVNGFPDLPRSGRSLPIGIAMDFSTCFSPFIMEISRVKNNRVIFFGVVQKVIVNEGERIFLTILELMG